MSWQSFASKNLIERNREVILKIGKDRFSKTDLALMECVNIRAARILNDLVVQGFNPKNVHDLSKKMSIEDLGSIQGIGEATAVVWWIVMNHCGIDADQWFGDFKRVPTIIRKTTRKMKKKTNLIPFAHTA